MKLPRNSEELSPNVFTTRVYSPGRCASILPRIRGSRAWSEAQIRLEMSNGNFRVFTKQSARAASILTGRLASQLCDNFERQVTRYIRPLVKQLWRIDLSEILGTQLVRYKPGGYYVEHTDAEDYSPRYISVVCYLNDDFEGGQTFFPSFEYSVQPSAGKAVIFPARYIHQAEPVITGEKYVLITWLCGPVAIRWI